MTTQSAARARIARHRSPGGAGRLASRRIAQDATTAGRRPPRSATDAQTPTSRPTAQRQEIIVTARRRNELLLDVPIAVTAYSGEQLERQGALDITDIGDTTPNVTLETSRGTNTTLTAFIRGVGQQDPVAGFEQGVGIYLDDVYLNRRRARCSISTTSSASRSCAGRRARSTAATRSAARSNM